MTLASSLNFTVEISKPRDGEKWGRRLSDGSWTGKEIKNYNITVTRILN